MSGKPLFYDVVSLYGRRTVDYETAWSVRRVGHYSGVVTKENYYACASRGVSKCVFINLFQSGDVPANHFPKKFFFAFKREVETRSANAQAIREIGQ